MEGGERRERWEGEVGEGGGRGVWEEERVVANSLDGEGLFRIFLMGRGLSPKLSAFRIMNRAQRPG